MRLLTALRAAQVSGKNKSALATTFVSMNFLKKQLPIFEILLVAVIFGIHLYAALSDAYNLPNSWFTRDDAYYYFKVAQNITEGHGSTFDSINPTNGYHPLWMVICIPIFALARFDLILPLRVMLMVMAGFNAATAILIFRLVKNNLSPAVAYLAAPFWAFNFYIHDTVYEYGLETPLAAFAIVLFIYKLSQFEKDWRTHPVTTRQLMTLAGIATLVMFSRLDLVFLAVLCGIWIIFRGKPIRFLLSLDMVIIFLSMTTSVALRTGIALYNSLFAAPAVQAVFVALVVKITALYFFGAYQHPRANSVFKTISQTFIALTTSTVFIAGLSLLLAQLGIGKDFPRSAFVIDWGLSFILIAALRLAGYWFGNLNHKGGKGSQRALKKSFVHLSDTSWSDIKTWFKEAVPYYGILGGALALYMIFNKIMFGASSPVSGQIKRWWGTLGETVYDSPAPNWTAFFGISFQGAYDAWQPASGLFLWLVKLRYPKFADIAIMDDLFYIFISIMALIVVVTLFANARRTRRTFTNMAFLPLMAGCGIQILSYTTTAYGGAKEWYWISQMIFVTLLGSVVLDFMIRPLNKARNTRLAMEAISMTLGAILAYRLGAQIVSIMPYNYFPPERPYMEVLPYLEANTPPGSIIGMTGGGNVGYFIHDRTIVNMDGLINSSDYFHALQNGEAPAYLRERGMTIIFASPRLLELPPYFGQFNPYLESYSEYGGKALLYLLEEPKY